MLVSQHSSLTTWVVLGRIDGSAGNIRLEDFIGVIGHVGLYSAALTLK